MTNVLLGLCVSGISCSHSHRVAHTGSCKQWLDKLRASKTPLLICLTHCDKLYAEVKGDTPKGVMDPNKLQMEQEFHVKLFLFQCMKYMYK